MAKTTRTSRSSSTSRSTPAARRKQLEQIDRQLVGLLSQRAALVAEDAAQGWPSSILAAQQQTADLVASVKSQPPATTAALQALMRQVVGFSMLSVTKGQTAYLGPEYSYSHLAAIKCFGDSSSLVPVNSIPAVFTAIVRNDCLAGVVPIENSTDGRVVDTLGMFLKHRVRICGEVLLPIHHNLLSRTARSEITEVYSKPQALSQCRGWLAHNLPTAKLVEMSSTAAAAQLAAERVGAAAVASLEAGSKYALDVVAASIEDNKSNVTRFALLGNQPNAPSGRDKTAILFQVLHEPGALASAMMLFKKAGLNLTWIESFPLPGVPNEYLFFIELEGHETDPPLAEVIAKLQKRSQRCEILGSYPRAS